MLRKNDLVRIIAGKDNGKSGKIEKITDRGTKIVVSGINMVKRHQKAKYQGQTAGIIDKEMPINISNAMLICPSCNKPTRLGSKMINGKKVRICAKCKEIADAVKTNKEG